MDIFEAIARGIADELKQDGLSVSLHRSLLNPRFWMIEQNGPPRQIALHDDLVRVYAARNVELASIHYGDPGLFDTLITLLRGNR